MEAASIMGIPLYSVARHKGMGGAPRALRNAGLLEALGGSVDDAGDMSFRTLELDIQGEGMWNFDYFRNATSEIFQRTRHFNSGGVFLIGGECSATVGAIAGLKASRGGKPGMLWMDAHGDFNTPDTSPSGYIGGMALAMSCGRGPRMNEDVEHLRPGVPEDGVVHIGSRALDAPEVVAFESSPAEFFTTQHVRSKGTREIAQEAARHLENRSDWVVCHLDVDVIDPGLLPAVSYPAPDGLWVDEVLTIIDVLKKTGKLAVFELAAYNPEKDVDGSSARKIVDLISRAQLWS